MRGSANRVVPDVSSGGSGDRRVTNASPPRARSPGGRNTGTSKRKKIVKDLVATIHNAPRSPRRILKSLRGGAGNHRSGGVVNLELQADRDLTQFLTLDCPTDVLPKILAYAGPISAAALQQTSRHFRDVLNAEGTWRGLCEELYKVGRLVLAHARIRTVMCIGGIFLVCSFPTRVGYCWHL